MKETTVERHQKIYKTYLEVMKSYGKYSGKIGIGEFYEEVAELWSMSKGYIASIVPKMIKKDPKNLNLLDLPFEVKKKDIDAREDD